MGRASAAPVVPSEKCMMSPSVKVGSTDDTSHLAGADLLSLFFSFFFCFVLVFLGFFLFFLFSTTLEISYLCLT